jgi:hypothetical protein
MLVSYSLCKETHFENYFETLYIIFCSQEVLFYSLEFEIKNI